MKKTIVILLFLYSTIFSFAATVDTLNVYSNSMQKNIANVVILPKNYAQNTNYPVVYLLHGASGNYKNWIEKVPEIQDLADQYHTIIVCPDGHETSWYLDSPIDKTMRYETYITQELINKVDKTYKTIPTKNSRAITGLSMGGHGALYLAFKHQDIFGAAGSMSGGVNLEKFPNNWKIAKRLGTYDENPENWKNNSVVNMVTLVQKSELKIIFDCGVDDFFYEVNKELHQKLLLANVPHDYIERPGKHNWDYWKNAVAYHFLFFDKFFHTN